MINSSRKDFEISKIEQEEYSTFLLFKQNVSVLQTFRPDLYFSLECDKENFSIRGKLIENIEDINKIIPSVIAINTSIILNSTSYFEGFLENILLRYIGKITDYPMHIQNILKEYQQQIIKISSFLEFKKIFQKLFGESLKNIQSINNDDIEFIDKFYTIRHLVSHGSKIETASEKLEIGRKIFHTDRNYIDLMGVLKKRYHYKNELNIELITLLNFSEIVDDFSNTIFDVATIISDNLKQKGLIDSSNFWGDFSGRGTWGEI